MSMQNVIIIRSVRGKVGNTYYIQPCPNPSTRRYQTVIIKDQDRNPVEVEIVKRVDSNGNIILTDWERNSGQYFVAETEVIEVTDGTTFDLDDPVQEARWKAIEYCDWIAKDRFERDANGDLVIDGNARNYGVADLYIERPGELTKKTVSKKKLVARAYNYIFEDGDKSKRMKAKVLGRNLDGAPMSDVDEYLTQTAERDPNKIINIYEGEDWKLQLLILEAVDRGVIRRKDGIYTYGDDKVMGASMESAILFMRDITNRTIVTNIKKETYPEYLPQNEINSILNDDPLTGSPLKDELDKDKTKNKNK